MKERMRNRHKTYPAPKATISSAVFLKAVAKRRLAEAVNAGQKGTGQLNVKEEGNFGEHVEVTAKCDATDAQPPDDSKEVCGNGEAEALGEENILKVNNKLVQGLALRSTFYISTW